MIRVGLHSGGVMTVADDGTIDVSQVTLWDIAHGLARVNRFGGQTDETYSVAEHSVRLARWIKELGWASNRDRRAALLHDAPECLGVGDVQRFIKRKYADTLRDFDARLTLALWDRLGDSVTYPADVIHVYDSQIGSQEAQWFRFPYEPGTLPRNPCGLSPIRCWAPWQAEQAWTREWEGRGADEKPELLRRHGSARRLIYPEPHG